jgi:hypothetical protein
MKIKQIILGIFCLKGTELRDCPIWINPAGFDAFLSSHRSRFETFVEVLFGNAV